MQTSIVQYKYSTRTETWMAREKSAPYADSDALLLEFKKQSVALSQQIWELANLDTKITPMEEAKLVFKLEAVLDMRRELMHEKGNR